MKLQLPLSILSAALLAAPSVFGQAAYSGTVGFSNLTCPAGTSIVVPTLVNSSVYQGQATISADGLTITPTIAPTWTAGAYAQTAFTSPTPNYPKFYAEIVSGAQEGLILDIGNNSATALTMANAVSPSSLRGSVVQIAVREHVTLDKVAQGSTGLSDIIDAVGIFNSNGSQAIRLYNSGSWMTDDFVSNAGHTVIYPGTGFLLTNSSSVTFSFMGEVKPTKTQVPVYANVINVVGPLSPASGQLLYNNSLANAMEPILDGINNFSTNGTMAITGTYLSDGSQITDGSFNALTPASTDAIPLNRGVVLSVVGDSVWTINSPLVP